MIRIFIISLLTLLIVACKKTDFLDASGDSLEVLDKAKTFSDSVRTMQFLTGIYEDLSYNFQVGAGNNSADFAKICDEAEGRYPALGNFDKAVTQGTFASGFYSTIAGHWAKYYADINNANVYLAEVGGSPLSESQKTRTRAEARFLRAFYYHMLIKYFGGVPILGDQVYTTSAEATAKRNTFAECVDYIVSELDEVAGILPESYSSFNFGRVTKGACMALKSRVLLFAASPLYNGGSTATNQELKEQTAYPTFDQNRWELARTAALNVINTGLYALNVDNDTRPGNGFYQVFLTRVNNEFILPRPLPNGKQMEIAHNPRTRGGANFYFYPTQNLVDMFPMRNGLPITSAGSGYNAADPYANRDPRFGYTVMHNESSYFLQSAAGLSPVYTYVNSGNDGIVAITSNTQTITGYYVRKMCDERAAVTGGSNVQRSLPIIRYAEILLNYAEASNETERTADALNTLKQIRERAGILPGADNMFGLPAAPTKEALRDIIRNERAIELAFEQHRFWDLRRWKIGTPLLDGKYVQGMRITKTGNNYTYQRIDVRTRYFKEIYYYLPIPLNDVIINPNLLQNPGY